MAVVDESVRERIDQHLQEWRQGDCVLGEHWFLFRVAVDAPLTEEGAAASAEFIDAAESEVVGLMVATQTCDIVRKCMDRPFVEVRPLIEVDPNTLTEIERGRRPAFAFIPNLVDQRLVADLDRVMTVEKGLVSKWLRHQGCCTDDEARRLADALARKRRRTAFPDDFVRFASPLTDRMSSKHGRNSEEGRALRALREIRVRAAPSWDAKDVELTFLFIRNEDEPALETEDGTSTWSPGYIALRVVDVLSRCTGSFRHSTASRQGTTWKAIRSTSTTSHPESPDLVDESAVRA